MTTYLVLMATVASFSAILALGLNFQWGIGGMVNFGLAGLYSLGAYSCALLILEAGTSTLIATLGAVVVVAAVCAVMAIVTIRVSEEDYFAIVTLGVGEMLRLVILNEDWLTRGALGLTGIPRPLENLVAPENYVYLQFGMALLVLVGVVWLLNVIAHSPFGRIMRAVREDDVVTGTLGKNVLWARVRIFAIGGGLIGLAGAMHAFYFQYIDPTQFSVLLIGYAFMAVIAGGRGAHVGVVFGAIAVMILLEGSRFLKDLIPALDADQLAALRVILIGIGLLALLIFRPQGFFREYRLRIPASAGSTEVAPLDAHAR